MMPGSNGYTFRRVRQLKNSHPLVKLLIDKMNEQGVGVIELCREAGVGKSTFFNWSVSVPKIDNIEACFNVLGYTLLPTSVAGASLYKKEPLYKREYVVTSPVGNDLHVIGLRDFCRFKGLDHCEMYRIAGTGRTHKGWGLRRA